MIVIAICIISILLVIIVLFIRAINGEIITLTSEIKKVWVIGANISKDMETSANKIDEFRRDFKLTFDDKFARRVEEIIGLGISPKDTMQIIGMDGKPHIVPIDKGY